MSALAAAQPSAARRAAIRVPAGFLGIFVCLAGSLAVLRPVLDPDIGWHVRTGQLILASHVVPTTDPYSFTRLGAPWVEHEWLWQVAAALLDMAGGRSAIAVANGLAVGLVLGLIYMTLRDRGVAAAFAAAGTATGLAVLAVYAEARPGMVVGLFSAGFIFAFERYRRSGNWKWLCLAPAIELLWANMHGSYILGLALCGCYGLGAVWETRRWRSLTTWLATGSAAVAASLLNPLGPNLYRFTLGASQLSVNRQLVYEWQPPDFRLLTFAPVFAGIVLLLAMAIFGRVAPRSRTAQLLLVAGCAGAMESQQFILFFAVAAAPLAGEMLQQVAPRAPRTISAPSAMVMAIMLAGLTLAGPVMHLNPAAARQAIAQNYPVDAVEYVEQQHLEGPLWNEFGWGGYLIGALPRIPVFADGRTEMYGNDFELEVARVTFGEQPAAPLLDRYGVQLALVKADSPVVSQLEAAPDWRRVYSDNLAVVLVREQA